MLKREKRKVEFNKFVESGGVKGQERRQEEIMLREKEHDDLISLFFCLMLLVMLFFLGFLGVWSMKYLLILLEEGM